MAKIKDQVSQSGYLKFKMTMAQGNFRISGPLFWIVLEQEDRAVLQWVKKTILLLVLLSITPS